MAVTSISNIYEPTPFNNYMLNEVLRKNAYLNSGLVVRSQELDRLASQGGRLFELPFWNPITIAEPEYQTDDSTALTPVATSGDYQKVVRQAVAEGWSSYDLVASISGTTGGDPMTVIGQQVGAFWNADINSRIVATLKGVIADNVANDAGDMVNDIAVESIAAQTAATKASAEALLDTMYSMADFQEGLGGMICHPHVFNTLRKANLIDYIPDSQGVVNIPTYLGLRVFQDRTSTVVAGSTDGYKYYTYIFGMGALLLGLGSPKVPSEVERDALAGTGGGQETLITRQEFLIHPNGFDWQVAAGTDPSYATLALATSWDRVFSDRYAINIACLISN